MCNSEQLQVIVDDTVKSRNALGEWDLDMDQAPRFFDAIDNYVRKAAFKSDKFDPEDACADIRSELWWALQKYGPRPFGKLFGDYTLKLKTKNVLTNRAKKRNKCLKSKINYIAESLDEIVENGKEGKKLPVEQFKEHKEEEPKQNRKVNYFKKFETLLHKLNKKTQAEFANILMSDIVGVDKEKWQECSLILIRTLCVLNPLYSKMEEEERRMNKLEEIRIGNRYVTKYGKVIEVRGKGEFIDSKTKRRENGFKIYVFATKREISVPTSYMIDDVIPYVEEMNSDAFVPASPHVPKKKNAIRLRAKDVISQPTEIKEEVHKEEEKPIVQVSPITEEKVDNKEEKQVEQGVRVVEAQKETKVMERDELIQEESPSSKKELVLGMIRGGRVTKDEIISEIMKRGMSKSGNRDKEASFVSVIISVAKREGVKIHSPSRNVYEMVQ
jgi:hypothetical protein